VNRENRVDISTIPLELNQGAIELRMVETLVKILYFPKYN